jgi:hypothetical protein
MSVVELVYEYRTLTGMCDLGLGLEWDGIDRVTAIEAHFTPGPDDVRMKTGRRFRREHVALRGLLRGDQLNDRVEIVELGLGGLVCRAAPYVARGEVVEIVIDDAEAALSYRFRARGVWLRDDGDDYRVGLALIGMPVCLRRVDRDDTATDRPLDLVDQIAA